MEEGIAAPWRLAVTRRCLEEDLGLSPDEDWRTADSELLRAFQERRSRHPTGSDGRIAEVSGFTSAPVYSLHVGRDRAATWYDQEEQIVWLLGVGRAHDYDYLRRLAERDRLLPTVEDYERLEPGAPTRDFAEAILEDVRSLTERAAAEPDRVVHGRLAGRIPVRVCVESGEPMMLVVAVSQRLSPGDVVIPALWQAIVASAFFPAVPFEDFYPFPVAFDETYVEDHELALRHPFTG